MTVITRQLTQAVFTELGITTFMAANKEFITPYQFGAQGDARNLFNTSITAGAAVVTNTVDQPFAASDVGKPCWIYGAAASGGIFAGTVLSYQSPTQITLTSNAVSTVTSGRCVIGTDDTTAMGLFRDALAPANGRSGRSGYLGHGSFLTGPLLLPNRACLYSPSKNAGGLMLKPGSATTNKYLLKNSGNGDNRQCVMDLWMEGLRDFQAVSGVLPTDIDLLVYMTDFSDTQVVDACNNYERLDLRNIPGALIKYAGKGGTVVASITGTGGNTSIDWNGFDSNLSNIHMQAYCTGGKLGSTTGSCRFDNVKFYYCGQLASGAFGAGETACWYLNGASYNSFSNCEGQESNGSVLVLNDAKRNSFRNFRCADAGCVVLAPSHGITPDGSTPMPTLRAGVQMLGASQGNELNLSIGARVHGVTSYATHAVYIDGTATGNTGNITTDPDLQFYTNSAIEWGTAKLTKTGSQANPALFLDGVAV